MSPNVRNFVVGFVSIIGLVAFAILLMLFGELDEIRTPRYEITVYMNNAGGLRDGSTVELDGVPIGRIDSITLDPRPERLEFPVRVVAKIGHDVRIPTSAEGAVETQLIAGAAIMQLRTISPPPGVVLSFHPTDGSALLLIEHKPLLEQLVTELDSRTEPLIQAMQAIEALSETYIEVGNNLNTLLRPQGPESLAEGELPNLHAAVVRFHDIIDDTQAALQLAQDWLGDEQLRQEVHTAVTKASRLIDDASDTMARIGQFTTQLEGRTDELAERLIPLADEMALIFEQVRLITHAAAEGDGTIGHLLNNPDLYNNLNDSAIRFERALREVQLFMQKVSAEGLPIRWF